MRHKAIATSLTLACCLAFALAAQDPSAGTKSQGKETSLTGCLEAGAKPNTYVLKNVSEQTAAGSETKPAELGKTESVHVGPDFEAFRVERGPQRQFKGSRGPQS